MVTGVRRLHQLFRECLVLFAPSHRIRKPLLAKCCQLKVEVSSFGQNPSTKSIQKLGCKGGRKFANWAPRKNEVCCSPAGPDSLREPKFWILDSVSAGRTRKSRDKRGERTSVDEENDDPKLHTVSEQTPKAV